jgi:hypothetical protein
MGTRAPKASARPQSSSDRSDGEGVLLSCQTIAGGVSSARAAYASPSGVTRTVRAADPWT